MKLPHLSLSYKPPFGALGRRVKTWWYGFEPSGIEAPAPIVANDQRTTEELNEAAERAKAIQMIWGEGYLLPGGPDYLLALVKPLNVNPAMSLLDLSAGLGGSTRHIATSFDVYITGLERSPDIAAQGHALSVKAGLAKKVPIAAYDAEHFELRPKAFDAILGQYLTVGIRDKERFFAQVHQALKPRGQFTFTDFCITGASAQDPRLKPWADNAAYPITPWKPQQYVDYLNENGFNCRVSEDQSLTFKSLVQERWQHVVRAENFRTLSKPAAATLFEEASKYMALLKLMDEQLIAFYRFYATAKPVIH
jgi:cyclopropane fatty-acyl-phospholipid synthase-like methyltransferase